MRPVHAITAAVVAICGFGLLAPAGAAPNWSPGVAPAAGALVQIDNRRHDGRHWRRGDGDEEEWEGLWDRRRGEDWDHDRGRHLGWERGLHRGWDGGRGHDWRWGRGRGDDWRWGRGSSRWRDWDWRHRHDGHWGKKHQRWHTRHHPRHREWVGRPFPRGGYSVIQDYYSYGLPTPYRGQFYARSDNDVFLVDEATRRILDAFVLYNAFGG